MDTARIIKAIKAVKSKWKKKGNFVESIDLQFLFENHIWKSEKPTRGKIKLVQHNLLLLRYERRVCRIL